MKTITIFLGCIICSVKCFSQVNELEQFRKEITAFINYDTRKTDSVPKNEANTLTFKKNADEAFKKFMLQKGSENLDSLKGNERIKYSYYFTPIKGDPMIRSLENNADYMITIYGVYDYGLNKNNFVTLSIQPFIVGQQGYVIYYYSLNGEGNYYIKDVAKNKICFEAKAFTSNLPILEFKKIDATHFFIAEDMGDNGCRALVIQSNEKNDWQTMEAFKGNAFAEHATSFSQKVFTAKRKYLRVASTRTITRQYSERYDQISFNESTHVVSYKKYIAMSKASAKNVEAAWKNNMFSIDDYYLGENTSDRPAPMPENHN